MGKAARA